MLRRLIVIALAGAFIPFAAAQTPAPAPSPAAAKTYIPGLEQFMNAMLVEHNKLWFSGQARNWRLAEYELGEIKEIMGDVQDLVPVFKDLPLADMLDAVITKEVAGLETAIAARDFRKFAAGYDRLNAACNACHQATGNEFIVVKRPMMPAFTNQDYRPRQ